MAREDKIGERFEYLGATFETVEDTGVCKKCAFANEGWRWRELTPCLRPELSCDASERSDGKSVVFINVE